MGYVYKYIDLEDNITKYIGIIWSDNRSLAQRIEEHRREDEWCKNKTWRIEYFYVNTRTDAECLEAHYIEFYKTYNYYNTSKSNWGICSFLPVGIQWNLYKEDTSILTKLKDKNSILLDENNELKNKIKSLEYVIKEKDNQLAFAKQSNVSVVKDSEVDKLCNEIKESENNKICKKRGRPKTISDRDIELMYKLKERGNSMRQITKTLDVSLGTVHRYLNMYSEG